MMIDITKEYKTRDGHEVMTVLYAPLNKPDRQLIAIINYGDEQGAEAEYFYKDGRYMLERETGMDLIKL